MDTMQYEASQSEGGGHCVMVPVIICVLSDDEEDIDSLAEELPQCDGSTSKSSNSKQLSVHSEYGEQLENIQINLAKRSFDAEILRKASQNRKRFLHDADIRPLSETFWESKGSPCKHVTSGFHIALDSQNVDEPMSLDDGSEKAVPAENLREQSKVDVNLHHSKEASKLASIIENTSRALDSTVGHVKDTNLAPEQTSLGSVAENTEEGDEREEGPIISVNEEKHSYILEAGNKKGVVEGKLHNGISVPFCDEQTAILVESDKLAENCKQKSLISSSVAPMTNVLKEKTHKCSLSLKQESVTNRVALDHPQIATQQGQTLENCVSELCSKKISVKNVTRAIKSARRKELKWEKRPDTKPNDKDILNVQKLKTTEACSCVMCQSVFSRKIKHPILTHCDSKSYICKLCDYATNRKKALKIHVRIHTDIKPYKCGQCASACHTCHKSCNDCDYTERKESSLQAHTVPHTSTGLNSLRLHNKQHLDVGARFKCDQCEYFSNNSYNLQCHSRIHTGEKPYHCEECDYSFRTLSQLNRHKLVHLTSKVEEQFKCKQCKALFPSMRHLGRHARSHLELKQIFSCDQCDYSTYSSYNLKVHIRTHTGEKPYRCSECKTTFRTPSHLNRHKQIHLKHN